MVQFITARDLTWNKGVSRYYPGGLRSAYERASGAPDMDGTFSRTTLLRGQAYESLGEYYGFIGEPPTSGGSLMNDYFINGVMIKKPGTDEHILPSEFFHLSDVVQIVATHEYANSDAVTDKICFMTYRSLILRDDKKQIAENDWHVHKPPTPDFIRTRMDALAIPRASLMMSSIIDPDAVQSEYMISDMAGSLIQTAPAQQDMEIEERIGSFNLKAPAFAYRQTEPYEIVHGNSYTFHAAATPKPDEIGQRRTFMLMTYAATI